MPLERDFEKYVGGPNQSVSDRVHITLSRNGQLYLNQTAHNLLGRPQSVIFHYSREKDVIAVEPSNPRLAVSFPVWQKRVGWRINASPVCNHFNIRPSATERFVSPVFGADGILRLSLRDTVTVRAGRSKAKQR